MLRDARHGGANGRLSVVPIFLIAFAGCTVLFSVILNRTKLDLPLSPPGSNPKATEYSGVNTKGVIVRAYVRSGLFSGLASLGMISRFNLANAGYGKISGVVLALVILQLISSGLNLLQVSSYVTMSLWGILLLLVIGIKRISSTRRRRTL